MAFEMNPKSTAQAPEVIKLNDSVYQLYRPAGTRSVQVVFFHGFQLEDYESAHTTTWTSGDGSVWPQTWLVEKFPEAHVLSVSYNRWVTSARDGGKMDLFNICENLTSDLLSANINEPRCPIILVGHSFGGLVIKKLCAHVSNQMGCERDSNTKSSLKDFLNDVRGIFFYATPHRGISKEALAVFTAGNQSLLEYVTTLSTPAARAEFHFSPLSEKYKWRIVGLGESQAIKKTGFLAQLVGGEDLGVTPEASSRYGWRFNIAENTNHITITRPTQRTQRNYTALTSLLSQIKLECVEVKRPVHQTQGIPEYHVGLESSSRDVLEKLKKEGVLGIVGMGGIGKTTIAKAVFNKISTEFEYTCFVDNVKGINSHELEDRILGHFHQDGKRQQGAIAWSTLEGKKILLVMDDVNSVYQLKILPQPGYFGVGSRLIITSRDCSILKFYSRYYFHEVEFLRDSEAKKIFCQLAFGSQAVPEGNQHLEADVKRVLQKCQGLPLTLEMAGSYLKGHDGEAEFWDETIEKLGNVKDIKGEAIDRVWASILEMSYYDLAPVEQGMFLEAGTCFFGQPLERALAVWSSEHGCSITGWRNLLSKSMVKQVRKTKWKVGYMSGSMPAYREIEYMEVWVHEHFRDWAKKKCEGHMVIGVDEEAGRAVDLLKAKKVKAREIQTLRLSDRTQKTKLQLSLFNKAKNLKYLELAGILHEGFVKTCPRLYMLSWKNQVPSWNNQDPSQKSLNKSDQNKSDQVLPLNVKEMNKLAVLELSSMKVGKEFPEALQNLDNLRILSLCYLNGLDHLPKDFGNLSSLKQLELEGLRISTLPDSFCKLSALTHLSIIRCSSLEDHLPKDFGNLSSLQELELEGLQISTLPDSFCKLSALTHLSIVSCSSLETLPDSFGKLYGLKYLLIAESPILKRLPDSFCKLSALTHLSIVRCSSLEDHLPKDFGNLSSLKELDLEGLQISTLPDSFCKLFALTHLSIISCSSLETLPDSFGKLYGLKNLSIVRSPILKTLPDSFGNLKFLEDLFISACPTLEVLPENLQRLSSLKSLRLYSWSQSSRLPDLGQLKALVILHINEEFLNLRIPKKKLKLSGQTLDKLFGVPLLSAIEDLEVIGPWGLRRLPQNFGTLLTLKRLTISSDFLEELSENFGNLSALRDLTLACPSLERLPESFNHLCSLERLVMDGCARLRELPNVSDLTGLRTLTISEMVFQGFWAIKQLAVAGYTLAILLTSFGLLSALEDLTLLGFSRLPDNFSTLATLKKLTIRCRELKKLPESFGNLSALTDLTLECPRLERLPESFNHLCSLERLELRSYRVKRLPENFGTLATLKMLIIGCWRLEELPKSFGNLFTLTDLTLECPRLERVPESFNHLCCLERLVIGGCATLRELPNFSNLTALRMLTIDEAVLKDFPGIKELSIDGHTFALLLTSFGLLSALEDLTYYSHFTLPDNFGTIATLKRLTILGTELKELPQSFGNLSALIDLRLFCGKLGRLPESFRNLCSLERLELVSHRVTRLPENFGTLPALKSLTMECWALEELPESFGNLSALTDLKLLCRSLQRLPKSFKHLFSLERLVISGCSNLREVPTVSELGGQGRLTIDLSEDFIALNNQ